jgi:hypothetical protein
MSVPNLDRMEHDALTGFWVHHRNGYAWRELFPAGGKGTRNATADLASYAINRAAFLECSGPDRARTYETICMHIRERIPAWAMWEDTK